MMPEVRAAADRFMMDCANLRYLIAGVPADALEREITPLGWTLRQTIGHVVATQERYADTVARFNTHESEGGAFDLAAINAAVAEATRATPLPELMMRLDKSLITLFAGLAQLPEDDTDASLAWLVKAVTQWSSHISDHAIDFVDAVPEVRMDPMVLNWVLYTDYHGDDRRTAAQVALLNEVRESLDAEDDDESEDDEEGH